MSCPQSIKHERLFFELELSIRVIEYQSHHIFNGSSILLHDVRQLYTQAENVGTSYHSQYHLIHFATPPSSKPATFSPHLSWLPSKIIPSHLISSNSVHPHIARDLSGLILF